MEIFVIFGNGLAIKKTAVYLICDESIEMEMTKIEMDMEPSHLYCDDVIEKDTEPSNLYCDDVIEKDMEPSREQKKVTKNERLVRLNKILKKYFPRK